MSATTRNSEHAAEPNRFKPYSAYEDSGLEWRREIPAHWNVSRLKHVCTRIFVGIAEAATFAYVDDGIPMLRSTGVRGNRIRTDDIRRIDRRFHPLLSGVRACQ